MEGPPSLGRAAAMRGRSILRLDVMSGAVIMKITSSTSMTSISGVMLMSLIGCDAGVRSRRPNAMVRRWSGCGESSSGRVELHFTQVVREAFEIGFACGNPLAEDVVREHGRDRDGEAGGGEDEGLADRAGDLLDRDAVALGHAAQRMEDAPYGTEQANERRGGAGGGQHDLAELQLGEPGMQGVAEAARELRGERWLGLERAGRGCSSAASTKGSSTASRSIAWRRPRPSAT